MEKIKNNIIEFIKSYVKNSHAKGVIIGMSGGKDSFIVAKLCAIAIGKENVFGVIMPNGNMKDINVAKAECDLLEINYAVLNIENLYNETEKLSKQAIGATELNSVSTTNIAPRIRMTLLYTMGATLGYIVANTSNLSEKMIGYTTKWGDNVGDFAPLASLTKNEVCELGLSLGLPEEFVNKKPDDGLSGKTDEEKIGFSYDELDTFIRTGKKQENFEKIERMHKASAHKRNPISTFEAGRKNYFEK